MSSIITGNKLRWVAPATGSGGGPLSANFILLDAQALTYRGNWTNSTAYKVNDVVTVDSRSGQAFICIIANTNSSPSALSANWRAIAANPCTGADQQFVSVSSDGTIGPSGFDDTSFDATGAAATVNSALT